MGSTASMYLYDGEEMRSWGSQEFASESATLPGLLNSLGVLEGVCEVSCLTSALARPRSTYSLYASWIAWVCRHQVVGCLKCIWCR